MKTILITGASGFVGTYLMKYLIKNCSNNKIIGMYNKNKPDLSCVKWKSVICDITSRIEVEEVLKKHKPDIIFHLASQTKQAKAIKMPKHTFEVNIGGTINLFESIKKLNLKPRVLVTCSCMDYGIIRKEDIPVKEKHHVFPLQPYSISKLGQTLLANYYYQNYNIDVVIIRLFNIIGPSKTDNVCNSLSKQLVLIEKKVVNEIRHGNLEAVRTFMDVRDVCNALWLAIEKCRSGEIYNLSGTIGYKLSDLFDKLINMVDVKPILIKDRSLIKIVDEPIVIGDCAKFIDDTKWKPMIPIKTTLRDMLNYWREDVEKHGY